MIVGARSDPHRLRETFNDCKTQPAAAFAIAAATFSERLEDTLLAAGRQTRALVPDREQQLVRRSGAFDRDGPPVAAVLRRIGEEVDEDVVQQRRIRRHQGKVRRQL